MLTKLQRPYKLEICLTQDKGWGVFATSPIFKGEIIEECPVLEIPRKAYQCVPDLFIDYAFNSLIQNDIPILLFGFGGLYNHSNIPNAKWDLHPQNSKIFQFIAIENIKAGEEVFTYYGGEDYWAQRPHIELK
jgi:SET domain-containing protein